MATSRFDYGNKLISEDHDLGIWLGISICARV